VPAQGWNGPGSPGPNGRALLPSRRRRKGPVTTAPGGSAPGTGAPRRARSPSGVPGLCPVRGRIRVAPREGPAPRRAGPFCWRGDAPQAVGGPSARGRWYACGPVGRSCSTGPGWVPPGRGFLLLTHGGRWRGRVREVVHYDPASDTRFVASGWGERSQWFRNLQAHPEAWVTVGLRTVCRRARIPLHGGGARVREPTPAGTCGPSAPFPGRCTCRNPGRRRASPPWPAGPPGGPRALQERARRWREWRVSA